MIIIILPKVVSWEDVEDRHDVPTSCISMGKITDTQKLPLLLATFYEIIFPIDYYIMFEASLLQIVIVLILPRDI